MRKIGLKYGIGTVCAYRVKKRASIETVRVHTYREKKKGRRSETSKRGSKGLDQNGARAHIPFEKKRAEGPKHPREVRRASIKTVRVHTYREKKKGRRSETSKRGSKGLDQNGARAHIPCEKKGLDRNGARKGSTQQTSKCIFKDCL